jgi:muramoyltetrapeptide carboxypeptidase
MNFKTPPPLRPGDTIGIMAPSSRVAREDVLAGAKILEDRGYKIFIHPQTYETLHQSAGTNEQKSKALHDLARDPNIKAVFFATGGNRALHLLDHLDYALIAGHPKIYMGFSDNTALLNAITAKTGIVTYHGPTVKRLSSHVQIDQTFALLEGRAKQITFDGATVFREGTTTGRVIGGNLSLFQYLIASNEILDPNNAILFLEDVGEELSRLDRDFCYLRRCGLLNKIGALVLGQFNDLKDTGTPFGFSWEDVIAEHTSGLNIPILLNAPFGHVKELQYAFPIGALARLENTTLSLI